MVESRLSHASFTALLALFAGAAAAAISTAWNVRSWEGGLPLVLLPPDDIMEFDALESNVLLTASFMLAVPLLSLIALAAGTAARRHRLAQVGLVLGAAAVIAYALAIGSAFSF